MLQYLQHITYNDLLTVHMTQKLNTKQIIINNYYYFFVLSSFEVTLVHNGVPFIPFDI